MTFLVILWIAILAALLTFGIGSRRDGGALTLSYFLGLSLIHVPGAVAYAVAPSFLSNRQETMLGFELTLAGMVSFVIGATLVRALGTVSETSLINRDVLARVSTRMIIAGLLSYLVVLPVARFVPSLTSLVSPLIALLVIGLWIKLYLGIIFEDYRRTLGTFLALPLLPFLTTISGGFINTTSPLPAT